MTGKTDNKSRSDDRVSDPAYPDKTILRQELLRVGRAAAALGIDDLEALVRYILAEPNEVDIGLLEDVLIEIVPGQEERIMSVAAEQWIAKGKADILLRQLGCRFGTLPEAVQARVQCASEDQLNEWAEAVLDASTLDTVFGTHATN